MDSQHESGRSALALTTALRDRLKPATATQNKRAINSGRLRLNLILQVSTPRYPILLSVKRRLQRHPEVWGVGEVAHCTQCGQYFALTYAWTRGWSDTRQRGPSWRLDPVTTMAPWSCETPESTATLHGEQAD